jgi:hypothetical protein
VGGLAHFFEEEGIPTTQISLIREHTETIKPPRALWVPFELGRPLGVPNDPVFQKRVLLAALNLFKISKGPVIEDFPEDAPIGEEVLMGLSCPVDFSQDEGELTETETLCASLKREMQSLRPWYDLAVQKRGRTTVGISGVEVEDLGDFICAFLEGEEPENPREDIDLPYTMNLATDDLKAYYFEAITTQPGQESASSRVLSDWFYQETVAGKVLFALRESCLNSDDRRMKFICNLLIIPMAQKNKARN